VFLKRLVDAVGPPAVTAPCRVAPLVHAVVRAIVGAAATADGGGAADAAASAAAGGGVAGVGAPPPPPPSASAPSAAHLLEDALELWASALRHAPAYTPDVDALAAGLAPLATGDGDALRPALTLIDSYALLGGEAFRTAHGAAVAAALRAALDSVRERGVLAILDVLDTLLAVWPPAAAAALLAPLVGAALAPVLGPRGPRQRPPSGVVVAAAAASALRLAALSPAAFSAALASAVAPPPHGAAGAAPTEEAALQAFLASAHGHLDIMFTSRRRRMAVLGWVTLLAAAPTSLALLATLPALVDAVVQVLADDAPAAGGGGGEAFANVVARAGEGAGDGGGDADDDGWDPTPPTPTTPEDARRAAVAAADDVAGGRLPAAARAAFAATAAAVGGDAYGAALGRVDERVLRQAQAWLAT